RAPLPAILSPAAPRANPGPAPNAAGPPAAPAPAAAPQPPQRTCHRLAGSDTVVCGPQAQQGPYRIPRLAPKAYGPPLPRAQANLGQGVRATIGGRASNSRGGRRNRSAATLSVPF